MSYLWRLTRGTLGREVIVVHLDFFVRPLLGLLLYLCRSWGDVLHVKDFLTISKHLSKVFLNDYIIGVSVCRFTYAGRRRVCPARRSHRRLFPARWTGLDSSVSYSPRLLHCTGKMTKPIILPQEESQKHWCKMEMLRKNLIKFKFRNSLEGFYRKNVLECWFNVNWEWLFIINTVIKIN